MRVLTVAGAAAAAAAVSLPLWPVAAGAKEPDQYVSEYRYFDVGGVTCQIHLTVERYGESAGARTASLTNHEYCQDIQINQVSLSYVTTGGRNNTVYGSGSGGFVSAITSDAQSVTRSEHDIWFEFCDCGTTYTLTPK